MRIDNPDYTFAPWNAEQVESLNGFQEFANWHPFTCGGGGGEHSGVSLIAKEDGWHCPEEGCTLRQKWAFKAMSDNRWKDWSVF